MVHQRSSGGSCPTRHAVVLFDGVCNLCNKSVNWIIDRDPESYFVFLPLQSEAGTALIAAAGMDESQDSLTLIENGKSFIRSNAVLRIGSRLKTPLATLARISLVVPRPLRDVIYKIVAKNRYRLLGKADQCKVPTPELTPRFLDQSNIKEALLIAGLSSDKVA